MKRRTKHRIVLNVDHLVGDFVFLHTDPGKDRRMVTRYFVGPGIVLYELSAGATTSLHYGIEIGTFEEEKRTPGFKAGSE